MFRCIFLPPHVNPWNGVRSILFSAVGTGKNPLVLDQENKVNVSDLNHWVWLVSFSQSEHNVIEHYHLNKITHLLSIFQVEFSTPLKIRWMKNSLCQKWSAFNVDNTRTNSDWLCAISDSAASLKKEIFPPEEHMVWM